MSGTLKAFISTSGSLLNSNYRVYVVIIVVFLGVTRVSFFLVLWLFYTLRCVP